jgi:OFA family oxalate/formate antiporter-like MFS transporter
MEKVKNRGTVVVLAGLGINLALGILYAWSIFKLSIKESIIAGDGMFTWDIAALNDPYSVCCLVFAFAMILAGRIQDRLSPRITAIIGGILTGSGLMVISQSTSLTAWILGFGVLTGLGIGFGYASATPPAIKWFPSSKTGLIAGIVVAGFGLASVYIAPLATVMISKFGLNQTMMIFGISFLFVVSFFAIFLVNPPENFKPSDFKSSDDLSRKQQTISVDQLDDITPTEMLKKLSFYQLWFMYFAAAGAGLMIIGGVAGLAKNCMGDMAWVVVALMAVGNAAGRVVAGIVSDKIGRMLTMRIMMVFQAVVISALAFVGNSDAMLLVVIATLIGFNYGTNLSLFPSVTKDYYGLANFGVNYGFIFTAWGVGGFVLPRISQMIVAQTGTPKTAYIMASILLCVGALITFFAKSSNEYEEVVSPLATTA